MGKFEKVYEEMRGAVEHINEAVSGSEIDTDLLFIEKKIRELKKIRGTF